MKKILIKTITVALLSTLLVSCGNAETIQPLPSAESTDMPTVIPSPTFTVAPPTATPITLGKLNRVCVPNEPIKGWELSPNGKWMTAGFYQNEEEEVILQVVSLDCVTNWKVYLSKYQEKGSFSDDDIFIPYHWSKDGKFLYAIVGQRMSGCCWKGLRYVLLVRLDLETGDATAILKSDFAFDFIISDSDRYLVFTPPSNQPYDFAVLDFVTQTTQEITLNFKDNIDLVYAVMSPREDKIVLPLFRNIEYDYYYVNSIALIDLTTGKQELLVSGLTQGKDLYPVRWVAENAVLLSNTDPKFDQNNQSTTEYWLLNIDSHKIEKTEKP